MSEPKPPTRFSFAVEDPSSLETDWIDILLGLITNSADVAALVLVLAAVVVGLTAKGPKL